MNENYFMGLDGFVWFTGVVESRDDPAKLGRVQVRCLGYHTEDLNDIPSADLPWAHVMHPVTDPSMQGMGNTPSFLTEGTWVIGFFRDANEKQQPIIMGSFQHMLLIRLQDSMTQMENILAQLHTLVTRQVNQMYQDLQEMMLQKLIHL